MPTDKNVYLYYSGATDVTGPKLAETLGISSGKDFPKDKKLVIGWGCKLKKDYKFADVGSFLNHPNKIRANRNKFEALGIMKAADVMVADFVPINQAAQLAGQHGYPIIGRRNYHQGGKHFWLIMNDNDLAIATKEGAQYVQKFIDVKDEYRVHVAFDDVLYVAKKVETEDPSKSWKKQRIEKIEQKFDVKFEELPAEQKKLLSDIMDLLSKEHSTPDRIVRSNKRGWKFVGQKPANVPNNVKETAFKAVKSLGLDFGAVDIAVNLGNTPYVLEVNSAPGLEGTAFEKWSEALKNWLLGFTSNDWLKKYPLAARLLKQQRLAVLTKPLSRLRSLTICLRS